MLSRKVFKILLNILILLLFYVLLNHYVDGDGWATFLIVFPENIWNIQQNQSNHDNNLTSDIRIYLPVFDIDDFPAPSRSYWMSPSEDSQNSSRQLYGTCRNFPHILCSKIPFKSEFNWFWFVRSLCSDVLIFFRKNYSYIISKLIWSFSLKSVILFRYEMWNT